LFGASPPLTQNAHLKCPFDKESANYFLNSFYPEESLIKEFDL
jgi:hypothetical protein